MHRKLNPPGPWTKHVVTIFADGAHAAVAAHFDGDADLDIFTATFNGAEVVWFENGSVPDPWREHEISFDAPFACDVWADDRDGDGDTDVVVNYDGYMDWYEHDTSPTPQYPWTKHVLAPWPAGSLSVQASDLDQDGDMDVVNGAYWYENDGAPDPAFTARLVLTFPTASAVNSGFV